VCWCVDIASPDMYGVVVRHGSCDYKPAIIELMASPAILINMTPRQYWLNLMGEKTLHVSNDDI
jgi:hypothetical protein